MSTEEKIKQFPGTPLQGVLPSSEGLSSAVTQGGNITEFVKPAAEAHPVSVTPGAEGVVKVLHEGHSIQEAVKSINDGGVQAKAVGDVVPVSLDHAPEISVFFHNVTDEGASWMDKVISFKNAIRRKRNAA